jgi:electron transport complex protein RnfD
MNEKKERIILDVAYQPQVRTTRSTQRLMLDVLIALIPAAAVGIYQFGTHALLVMATSVTSAVFFEWLYRKLTKKTASIDDLSAVVTGLLLALTMPANCPAWIPVVGTFFAIVVVKQLYGGIGKNFLNPALAGRAFLLASYSSWLSGSYLVPRGLRQAVDAVTMATPLSVLYGSGSMPALYTVKSMFLGNMPGALGEISTLALLLGAAYLLYRKVITWRIPVSFLGTVFLLSLIFGGTAEIGRGSYAVYALLSGGLVLSSVFMATDYTTSPMLRSGKLIYGIGCGLLTMYFRVYTSFPEGISTAMLFMNALTPQIDRLTVRIRLKRLAKRRDV